MKKILAVMAIITLFIASSCKKDAPAPILDPIVRTDDPPKEMFPTGQYGNTYQIYIEKSDLDKLEEKGYSCFWDQNTGERRDCTNWYLLSAKKYWGIYQGRVYVSKSKDWYVLQPNTILDAQKAVKNKGAAIGYICNGCEHPWNNYGWIHSIEQ